MAEVLFERAPIALLHLSMAGLCLLANAQARRRLGAVQLIQSLLPAPADLHWLSLLAAPNVSHRLLLTLADGPMPTILNWQPLDNASGLLSLQPEVDLPVSPEQHLLQLLLETSPDVAVNWFIPQHKWDFSSDFCQLLGYQKQELLASRESWLALVLEEDRSELQRVLDGLQPAEQSLFHCCRFISKTGVLLWCKLRLVLQTDGSQQALRLLILHTDISSDKALQQQLSIAASDLACAVMDSEFKNQQLLEAMEKAKAADRAKSEFLATMSHEIRTPMNGVMGMVELLRDTPLNATQQDYLNTIRTSSDALLTVINDILDFSKIEAGKLDIDPVACDLRGLAEDVLELLAPRCHDKGLQLLLDYPVKLNSAVMADAGRIRQILMNLVGNAIKFTLKGQVCVRVRQPEPDWPNLFRIEVVDTGIGLSDEQQEHLFQPFSQADASTTRRYGGTGLGLAICKRLIELMGGRIGLSSSPGKGACFWFELELVASTLPETESPLPRLLPLAEVLLLASPSSERVILQQMLLDWGLRVIHFDEPLALVSWLPLSQAYCPRVILFDISSLSAEAVELGLAPIRRVQPAIPVMLALAAGARAQATAYIEAGCSACLIKPLRMAVLQRQLAAALMPQTLQPGLTLAEPVAEASLPAQVLLVDDNPVNLKVGKVFLEKCGCQVQVATNGIQALEMANQRRFDLIFMDCQMPDMDGYQATRYLRAESGPCRFVPIIALTANAMEEERQHCLHSGMSDFLAKPILRESLQRLLQKWLKPEYIGGQIQVLDNLDDFPY